MKKALALILSLSLCASLMAGCGGSGNTSSAASSGSPAASSGAASSDAKGKVYYLNFKPEADAAWQDLAAKYTQETGVPVKVVTAASGTYNDTLTAEMGKSEAPTLFQCGNAQSLIDWDDYCLDLTGTPVVGEQITDDFNIYNEDGELKAIGYCYEAFGIIVNKDLLKTAGYELSDITDFASLKKVADDIHTRSGELGFDAFASSGLDGSSSWRFSGHLANMPLYYEFRDDGVTVQPATVTGAYLDAYRNIWDLYINDSSAEKTSLTSYTGDMSQAEFGTGKAVFWQQGTWEFANLTANEELGYKMNPESLAMIPIYCGVDGETNAGLCAGTENCWAVNSHASEEDIQATLDFIYWVVTSDEGTKMMAEQLGEIPFKNAAPNENVFYQDASAYLSEGKYAVTWDFLKTPNVDSWRATVVSALAAYSADQSDANWDAVKTAFVDGWAYEYNVQNG